MVKKSFLKGFSAKNAVRNDFRTAEHLFHISCASNSNETRPTTATFGTRAINTTDNRLRLVRLMLWRSLLLVLL
jgi:hypothetical protein